MHQQRKHSFIHSCIHPSKQFHLFYHRRQFLYSHTHTHTHTHKIYYVHVVVYTLTLSWEVIVHFKGRRTDLTVSMNETLHSSWLTEWLTDLVTIESMNRYDDECLDGCLYVLLSVTQYFCMFYIHFPIKQKKKKWKNKIFFRNVFFFYLSLCIFIKRISNVNTINIHTHALTYNLYCTFVCVCVCVQLKDVCTST